MGSERKLVVERRNGSIKARLDNPSYSIPNTHYWWHRTPELTLYSIEETKRFRDYFFKIISQTPLPIKFYEFISDMRLELREKYLILQIVDDRMIYTWLLLEGYIVDENGNIRRKTENETATEM